MKILPVTQGALQSSPTIVFTIFCLKPGKKGWAFRQMGFSKFHLKEQSGLRFGLMLGTGQGRGFSLKPDFGRYALLSSWDNSDAAGLFLNQSDFYEGLKANSREIFTTHLLPVMAKGQWKGQNPFVPLADFPEKYSGPIVVLTRASIRWQRLLQFWKHVPGVSAETGNARGLLAQTGMGEVPVMEQATLSIWENEECLKAFAYQMRQHREVIQKTRNQHWYGEELFARFIPLKAEGSWNGSNPLAGKCLYDLKESV